MHTQRNPVGWFEILLWLAPVSANTAKLSALIISCGLSLMFSGCKTPSRHGAATRITFCPVALHHNSIDLPGVQSTSYDLEDGYIVKRVRESWQQKQPEVKSRRMPDASEWARFGRVAADLRIWEWKGKYSEQDLGKIIFDGHYWEFSCTDGEKSMDSNGSNAYPKRHKPGKSTLNGNSLQRLEIALQQLTVPKRE